MIYGWKYEAVEEIALALAKEGVTSFLATTITNPVDYTSTRTRKS